MLARDLVLLALLAAPPALAAEAPLAGGIPDLVGPRALGLSAAIGIASSNEGLFLNPATIGVRRRYSVETGALFDRRGAENAGKFFGGSVVDSMSSPVTGGVSYVRAQEGRYTGSLWSVALSGPLAQDVHVGLAGKYLDVQRDDLEVQGPKTTRAVTVDAGLYWQVAELVSVGAAGYNLVSVANELAAPMGAGAGIGIGSDRSFQVTADWRADFDRAGKTTNRYAAGAEVMLGRVLPVRGGFMKDETLGGNWWSVGAGLVSQGGIALDVGYRQSTADPSARTVAATLKIFLFR